MLQYHFSELELNWVVLRGRPPEQLSELPTSLRPFALKAIDAAHSILQHFVNNRNHREKIMGMPLYLHSMIAFAVVFLMKLSNRWHLINIIIDPVERTKPLVKGIITLLRECNDGAKQIIHNMANDLVACLDKYTEMAKLDGIYTLHKHQAAVLRPKVICTTFD